MTHSSDEWRSSTIAAKLKKKINELHDRGFSYVLRKFWRDHFYKYERVYLLRRDLSVPLPSVMRRSSSSKKIRFLAGKDDMEGFKPYLSDHCCHMEGLFDDGVQCAATFVDGAIVAYLWMIRAGLYDKELRYQVRCAPDEILQGVYVHPDYRGSPVLLELLAYGWDHYRQQGCKSVLGMVSEDNWSSIRMHLRLGFHETGQRLHIYKLTALRWTREESYQGQYLTDEKSCQNEIELRG